MKLKRRLLSASVITDTAQFTDVQIAALDLAKLPKNVRLRVKRPDGQVQIQHVGHDLRIISLVAYVFERTVPDEHSPGTAKVIEEALSQAAFSLDRDRRLYRYCRDGLIEIAISDSHTGAQALSELDAAVAALVKRTNQFLAGAQGMRLVPLKGAEWDRARKSRVESADPE